MNRRELVLKSPVITEKSTLLKENMHTLAFKVLRDANKIEIKDAVENIFKVKVASVRTANFHGKKKRQGKYVGRRSDWKKAYVQLTADSKAIEFFESLQ